MFGQEPSPMCSPKPKARVMRTGSVNPVSCSLIQHHPVLQKRVSDASAAACRRMSDATHLGGGGGLNKPKQSLRALSDSLNNLFVQHPQGQPNHIGAAPTQILPSASARASPLTVSSIQQPQLAPLSAAAPSALFHQQPQQLQSCLSVPQSPQLDCYHTVHGSITASRTNEPFAKITRLKSHNHGWVQVEPLAASAAAAVRHTHANRMGHYSFKIYTSSCTTFHTKRHSAHPLLTCL